MTILRTRVSQRTFEGAINNLTFRAAAYSRVQIHLTTNGTVVSVSYKTVRFTSYWTQCRKHPYTWEIDGVRWD